MHTRAGYTLAYVSGLPQGLWGEEILDGGGGKEERSFYPFALSPFRFSLLLSPHTQARYTLLLLLLLG